MTRHHFKVVSTIGVRERVALGACADLSCRRRHMLVDDEGKEIVGVKRVLCDSGESEFQVSMGQTLKDVLDAAAHMLEGACLTNVVVVQTSDGKYYVGDFSFEFREVDAKEAKRVAKDFGPDRDG